MPMLLFLRVFARSGTLFLLPRRLCKHLDRLFPLFWSIGVKGGEMPGVKAIKLSTFDKMDRKPGQEAPNLEIASKKLLFQHRQTSSLIDRV